MRRIEEDWRRADDWIVWNPGNRHIRPLVPGSGWPEHRDGARCVVEVQRIGVRIAGLRIGAGRVVVMRVRVSRAGTFMRVELSLPEPGEQQAQQRNAQQ